MKNLPNMNGLKRALLLSLGVTAFASSAQAQNLLDYISTPPMSQEKVSNPMIMLTLSSDHQLYFKAYNDYDDILGNDGIAEITYTHNYDYTGYFDNNKCYTYATATGVFSPTATAPVADVGNGITNAQYCPGAEWSGNFLNWASMTRIDIVRSVLYGGKREIDTATRTVLERSYLPNDAHSFAKYYDGADIGRLIDTAHVTPAVTNTCGANEASCQRARGVTFCNTTLHPETDGLLSQNVVAPPLLRVVEGNYSFWASSERFQCLYQPEILPLDGSANSPGVNGNDPNLTGVYAYGVSPESGTDYQVRVEVCGANSANGAHNCVAYGNNRKPEGILQRYGADGEVKFGLMTGGYNTNKSFGVLRKNVDTIDGEFDPDDGTFVYKRAQSSLTDSLIGTLDALRIVDYQYFSEDDNLKGTYNSTCQWGWTRFNDGECRNWGNPFGELMAESYRYFAGAQGGPSVTPSGANLPTGLGFEATWSDPIDEDAPDGACASMNVIGFNASYISYDDDFRGQGTNTTLTQLGLPGTKTLGELTNEIGQLELTGGQKYFVGSSDMDANGVCTPKTINNLASVTGVCPEAPRLQGSYLGAGLSYHVHTNDMRPNLGSDTNTIETIGVSMAGNLPNIRIPVSDTGRFVTILPACRNNGPDEDGEHRNAVAVPSSCALVDFRVLSRHESGSDGRYFVAWEDSEQGGDFDTDLNGLIEYRIVSTVNGTTLEVDTLIFNDSTDSPMGFGFVISGTGNVANEGFYTPSGVNGYEYPGFNCEASSLCSVLGEAVEEGHRWHRMRFNIATAEGIANNSAELPSPLYFASKWGFFNEETSDDVQQPDADYEWDSDGSGTPDAYLLVTDPSRLQIRIQEAIENVLNRFRTSTSASVSVNTATGEGSSVHTLYKPRFRNNGKTVNWVSSFSGVFLDRFLNYREDSVGENGRGDQTLTDADTAIDFTSRNLDALFNRYTVRGDGTRNPEGAVMNLPLEDMEPVWDARNLLADVENLEDQRAYGAPSNTGRYIFTGVDAPDADGKYDGQITDNEKQSFDVGALSHATRPLRPLLDADRDSDSDDYAENVVQFIRGVDGLPGMRSRKVDWGYGGEKVWRLGAIVNSTAAQVGVPHEDYDRLYRDPTYTAYRAAQRDRRQMIYVGANDGLLHAFNGGFFDPSEMSYLPTPEGLTDHPLGGEVWAYAPYNLLPHLKWLTSPDYGANHVYYVDSEVQKFDVNIFEADSDTYVGGWGTIIVVGMRFGGGDYRLNRGGEETTLRSAYMIFDVTNPEVAPRLLGEISHDDLGHTFGKVAVAKKRVSRDGTYTDLDDNQWHLVFGSGPHGPNAILGGQSDQPAKLFSLNLNRLVNGNVTLHAVDVDDEGAKSFVGGVTVTDWNLDYTDDMVYFGLVGDGRENSRGALMHAELNGSLVATNVRQLLTGVDGPFSSPPLTVLDRAGNYWVYAGTGRFYVQSDLNKKPENDDDINRYYGVRVNDANNRNQWISGESIPISALKPVSEVRLFVTQSYGDGGEELYDQRVLEVQDGNSERESYSEYASKVDEEYRGWYRDLTGFGENHFTRSVINLDSVIFNAYTPDLEGCLPSGYSSTYVVDMSTGLPQGNLRNPRTVGGTPGQDGTSEVSAAVGSTPEMASDPVVINNQVATLGGDSNLETENIEPMPVRPTRRSWREISSDELTN